MGFNEHNNGRLESLKRVEYPVINIFLGFECAKMRTSIVIDSP
jgi:hypothetical protein